MIQKHSEDPTVQHIMFCLTIKELGALGVAILHLLTFVSSCLHVAICGGKHSCPRLYQELTDLDIVTGGSTVEGSPRDEERKKRFERIVHTGYPGLFLFGQSRSLWEGLPMLALT